MAVLFGLVTHCNDSIWTHSSCVGWFDLHRQMIQSCSKSIDEPFATFDDFFPSDSERIRVPAQESKARHGAFSQSQAGVYSES